MSKADGLDEIFVERECARDGSCDLCDFEGVREARAVVIATGSEPAGWAGVPLDGRRLLSHRDLVTLTRLPRRLLVLAGRPAVQLSIADDGTAGIARARDWSPHLVLVDMQLPDMDGTAVLRALQSDPGLAGVPCIALSANAMSEDIDAAKAAGFVDYWTKPIDFQRFLADLSHRLGRPI